MKKKKEKSVISQGWQCPICKIVYIPTVYTCICSIRYNWVDPNFWTNQTPPYLDCPSCGERFRRP